MSEKKRFTTKTFELKYADAVHTLIYDNGIFIDQEKVCELLNEQQEMIDQLEKENTALLDLAEDLGVKIVEAKDDE